MLSAFFVLALAGIATASSDFTVAKRQATTPKPNIDGQILNFALTLEFLERDFYDEGLRKFDSRAFSRAGFPRDVRPRFLEILDHEREHVDFLVAGLAAAGVPSVSACQYRFPLDTVKEFVSTARTLEGVGITAYRGAAPALTSPDFLSVAASILSIEARHSSYLNDVSGISPFPNAYDAALTVNQVFTLAAQFIVPGSCDLAPFLPAGTRAFPIVRVKTAVPRSSRKLGLNFPLPPGGSPTYFAAFVNGLQTIYVPIDSSNGVTTVPAGLKGATYLIVTTDQTLADSATVAAGALFIL